MLAPLNKSVHRSSLTHIKMDQVKQVVLCLREADINDLDLYKPVHLYLEKHGHSPSEIEANRHFIHIQPPNWIFKQAICFLTEDTRSLATRIRDDPAEVAL